MPKKVNIELRPYDALAIISFLREYINADNVNDPRFAAIHESVKAYEDEIYKKLNNDHIDDAILECKVNDVAERHPPKSKQ